MPPSSKITLHLYFPISIIRPFNTFGPRQSERAVIPTIISQYLSSKKFLKIGSLKTIRDFTYVEDTAKAFTLAIKSSYSIGEIINLGTNFGLSISEIINLISKILNKKLIIKTDKQRIRPKKSEVNKLISSNAKAKKLLKWKPYYCQKKGFEKALIQKMRRNMCMCIKVRVYIQQNDVFMHIGLYCAQIDVYYVLKALCVKRAFIFNLLIILN